MPNANVNKVTLSNGTTLIDLTGDTVTSASHIVAGYVGHLADGSQVAGTAPKKHTATVTARTNSGGYVRYIGSTGTQYSIIGDTFEFNPGEELYAVGMDSRGATGKIIIDGVTVASGGQDSASYTYTLPDHDISISFSAGTTSIEEASSVSLQSKSVSYTPSETAQTATVTADSGYDGLSSVGVSVGAISGSYVGSQVPTQAAQTIHPSTSAQTIASGKYLTGAQTVEAVTTNITADKIVSGFTAKIGSTTDDDCVASILGTASSGGTYGTKSIAANGTYAAEDDGYDGYSAVTVDVPTGGGGSNIKIGIANTSIPNILNMFYALENGTATTGEFTLAQTIPNTSTLILDTGLSTVNGLFIADESQATLNTGTSPENTLLAIVFNPTSSTGTYAMTRLNIRMSYGASGGLSTSFLNRVSAWEVSGGKLYATGTYNHHNNYTPFAAGHTYRWVAW